MSEEEEDLMPALVKPVVAKPPPSATAGTKAKPLNADEEDAPPVLLKTAMKRPFAAVSTVPTTAKSEEGFSVTMRTQALKTCLKLLADKTNPINLLFQANQMEMYTADRDSPDFTSLQFFKPYITINQREVCLVSLSKASRQRLIRELHAHQTLYDEVTLKLNAKEPKPFLVDIFGTSRPVDCKLVSTTLPDNSKKKLLAVVERTDVNALHFANILLHASQFSNLVDLIIELDTFKVVVATAAPGTTGVTMTSWTMKLNKQHAVGSKLHMKNLPLARLIDVVIRGAEFSLNCTVQVNEHQTSINILFEVPKKFTLNFFVKEKKLKA
ncbi:hypothetical protein BASA81_015392 [Batrachochytrium salamandrivorans]|nr:hypothetical protein BASA81_015392 [Batrachochytrium salamandrivorans]